MLDIPSEPRSRIAESLPLRGPFNNQERDMTIPALDHVTIKTTQIAETVAFYQHYLGLAEGFRPPGLQPPGVWLYAKGGSSALIHLIELNGDKDSAVPDTGNFDHFNMRLEGFAEYLAKVKAMGCWHNVMVVNPTLVMIQHRDPNGVMLEVQFLNEAVPNTP
jgi:catechol 2,3-dioxygenase-like lactoylglutathione lyase family enzyme